MPTINWSFENDDDPAGSLMNSNSTTFFLAEHMEAKWYIFQMAGHEREVSSQGGHNFQGVHVYGKAQLGNTYYFGALKPDIAERPNTDR